MSELNAHLHVRRKDAKSANADFYFTGKPCKHGHLEKRRTHNGQCCECARIYFEKSYSENKSQWLERSKQWAEKNKDKAAEKSKRWRSKNPEKVRLQKRLAYHSRKAIGIKNTPQQEARIKQRDRQYKINNREKLNARSKERYAANKEKIRAAYKINSRANREKIRDQGRLWRANNPATVAAIRAKRKAAERNAVPIWFGEFDALVAFEAISLSKKREKMTGIKWEVDHMIPIRAKDACGLHVGTNLQVIPRTINCDKGNKQILTKTGEWIALL